MKETPAVVQRAFGLIIVVAEGRLKAGKAQISFWHSPAPVGWRSSERRDKVDSQSDDRRRVASTACSKLPIDDNVAGWGLKAVGTRVDSTYECTLDGGGHEDEIEEQRGTREGLFS